MAFDLSTAKLRVGLPAGVPEDNIEFALSVALTAAEKYCDRFFLYRDETVWFYYWVGDTLQLPRYPIDQLYSATGLSTSEFELHHLGGKIKFKKQRSFDEIEINYAGGYKVLPPDLELALFIIFDSVYASLQPGGAHVAGASAITSISIPDVGTIRYSDGGKGSSSSGDGIGIIPDAAVRLLEPYKNWAV